ncbi:MAG: hypothetical protein ABIQ88_22740 [Chitinophagaceae bacterium]
MTTKQPKPVFSIVLSLLLGGFVLLSCNNSAETSKDPMADTASRMAPMPDTMKVDTVKIDTIGMKMDTADTKPVKVTN